MSQQQYSLSNIERNYVSMSRTDYVAIEHACDHTARALSASQAAEPFDSVALIALDNVRLQLESSLRTLKAIKSQAHVPVIAIWQWQPRVPKLHRTPTLIN